MEHPFAGMVIRFVLVVYTVTIATSVYDVVRCSATASNACIAERAALIEVSNQVPMVLFAWLADSPLSGRGSEKKPTERKVPVPRKKQDDDPRNNPEPMG